MSIDIQCIGVVYRSGARGSGAARVTPHTMPGGYLTSEASTATTVARNRSAVKAGCAGLPGPELLATLPSTINPASIFRSLTHLHMLGLGLRRLMRPGLGSNLQHNQGVGLSTPATMHSKPVVFMLGKLG